jgi:hypothetical protein
MQPCASNVGPPIGFADGLASQLGNIAALAHPKMGDRAPADDFAVTPRRRGVVPRIVGVVHGQTSLPAVVEFVEGLPQNSKIGLELSLGAGIIRQFFGRRHEELLRGAATFFVHLAARAEQAGHSVVFIERPLSHHLPFQRRLLELASEANWSTRSNGLDVYGSIACSLLLRYWQTTYALASGWRSEVMERLIRREEWHSTDCVIVGRQHAFDLARIFHTHPERCFAENGSPGSLHRSFTERIAAFGAQNLLRAFRAGARILSSIRRDPHGDLDSAVGRFNSIVNFPAVPILGIHSYRQLSVELDGTGLNTLHCWEIYSRGALIFAEGIGPRVIWPRKRADLISEVAARLRVLPREIVWLEGLRARPHTPGILSLITCGISARHTDPEQPIATVISRNDVRTLFADAIPPHLSSWLGEGTEPDLSSADTTLSLDARAGRGIKLSRLSIGDGESMNPNSEQQANWRQPAPSPAPLDLPISGMGPVLQELRESQTNVSIASIAQALGIPEEDYRRCEQSLSDGGRKILFSQLVIVAALFELTPAGLLDRAVDYAKRKGVALEHYDRIKRAGTITETDAANLDEPLGGSEPTSGTGIGLTVSGAMKAIALRHRVDPDRDDLMEGIRSMRELLLFAAA